VQPAPGGGAEFEVFLPLHSPGVQSASEAVVMSVAT
jgi:hypothetical protein